MKFYEQLVDTLVNEGLWISIGLTGLKIIAIMLVTGILIRVGKSAIRNVFKVRAKAPLRFTERRESTLLKLLENVLTYILYFIAVMTVLSTLSIDVKGLIAGAGIVGLRLVLVLKI